MEPGRSSSEAGDEWVDVVDPDNRVVGKAQRREVRRDNLLHRGVGIVCRDSRDRIYVHRRTRTKDLFPGLYDMLVGGVVGAGESDGDAARREIREELGIAGGELRHLFHHLYLGPKNRAWVAVYEIVWDGPIVHQASEVEWGTFLALRTLAEMLDRWDFVPDGLEIYHRLCREDPRYAEGCRQSRVGSDPSASKGGGGASPPRNR